MQKIKNDEHVGNHEDGNDNDDDDEDDDGENMK